MPSTSARTPLPTQPQQHQSSILKRKAMSITQTYSLAHVARGKLSSEASRADHNLRLLVGHANLLDSLMLELAEAEQEQEMWFNQSVKAAAPSTPAPKHIQWADTVVEEPEEDWRVEDAESSDSDDSDLDDEDIEMAGTMSLTRVNSNIMIPSAAQQSEQEDSEEEEEDFEEDEEEDYSSLTLVRSPSHIASPPELSHDSESDSEDESMPPSPPSTVLPTFSQKQRQQIATTSLYDSESASQQTKLSPSEQASFFDEGYYLPQVAAAPVALSVY